MKKIFLSFMLFGVFFFTPKQEAEAQIEEILIIAIIEAIDQSCENQREAGTLQTRCKNGACTTVACISLRKICEGGEDDCN
jgi:hypothetical protein